MGNGEYQHNYCCVMIYLSLHLIKVLFNVQLTSFILKNAVSKVKLDGINIVFAL